MSGMAYIRRTYVVPAKRGARVIYRGGGWAQHGTITSAKGGLLRIRMDDEKRNRSYHPTWELTY